MQSLWVRSRPSGVSQLGLIQGRANGCYLVHGNPRGNGSGLRDYARGREPDR